jgi:hypothetical protein
VGFGRPPSQNGNRQASNISSALQRALIACTLWHGTSWLWHELTCWKNSKYMVSKSTRTIFNLYQNQLVPKPTRPKMNSSPSKLVPRWNRTRVNSYPSKLVKAYWARKSVKEVCFIWFYHGISNYQFLRDVTFLYLFQKLIWTFFFYFISTVVCGGFGFGGYFPLWVYWFIRLV